jgi:hypothetical protein
MNDAALIAADAALNSLIHNDPKEAEKEAIIQQRNRGLKDSSSARRVTNQTRTSRTDPDGTLTQKEGTPRQLKYKIHESIDADSRVILDTELTTGAKHDNQHPPRVVRPPSGYNARWRFLGLDRAFGARWAHRDGIVELSWPVPFRLTDGQFAPW